VLQTWQEALAPRLQAVQDHVVAGHERDHALIDEVHAIADVGAQTEDVPAGSAVHDSSERGAKWAGGGLAGSDGSRACDAVPARM